MPTHSFIHGYLTGYLHKAAQEAVPEPVLAPPVKKAVPEPAGKGSDEQAADAARLMKIRDARDAKRAAAIKAAEAAAAEKAKWAKVGVEIRPPEPEKTIEQRRAESKAQVFKDNWTKALAELKAAEASGDWRRIKKAREIKESYQRPLYLQDKYGRKILQPNPYEAYIKENPAP